MLCALADVVMDGNPAQPHCFPVGSMVDDTNMARPHSLAKTFELPFDPTVDQYFASVLAKLPVLGLYNILHRYSRYLRTSRYVQK